ncbi:DUF6789 family protein [Haladaptatus sp. CMSO5]|uniref:DUF6789 family protein n=1 Tax=Haladaptatus sp. CMSO5 TaxID=3120514 RepID=UPI002FCDF376
MAENDAQYLAEMSDDVADPDFDHLTGVITDGFVGAVGGLVGTAAMTIGLLVGASLNVFDVSEFASFATLLGLDALYPANPTAVGYAIFLLGGMIIWPLLLASLGAYLPGEKYAIKGVSFGFVLWTGFAPAFYPGLGGLALALYLVVTLLAHFAYGFTLGAVFDYLSTRPKTLV